MALIRASAPGKIILFGEHAVVYGRPAIAAPVSSIRATATFEPAGDSLWISAPQIGLEADWETLAGVSAAPGTAARFAAARPLAVAVRGVLETVGQARPPAGRLRIHSTIPLAAGLGSGAAVSVAVIRAVASALGHELPAETVSALAFEVEKLLHGTPSGIDNTVVTYARPVYFVRGQPGKQAAPAAIERLAVPEPFTIVIGDTGISSPTATAVGDLRRLWQANPEPYERLFDQAGALAVEARRLILAGRPAGLGPLMEANHSLLQQMGVSSPELDYLVQAARRAGALGAKLSGGGRGGNMIALVLEEQARTVAAALAASGAVRTIVTTVEDPGEQHDRL